MKDDPKKLRTLNWLPIAGVVVAALAGTAILNRISAKVGLEDFIQDGDRPQVSVDLTDGVYRVRLTSFCESPSDIESAVKSALKNGDSIVGISDADGRFRVALIDECYDHCNLLVVERRFPFLGYRFVGYLELFRQSEDQLLKRYEFRKPGGYTVAARTSIELPRHPRRVTATACYSNPLSKAMPDFENFRPEGLPDELSEAVGLARYMWSTKPRLGPAENRKPRKLCPMYRLDLLSKGEWATQCADFRDIFVNLARSSKRMKGVRYVGLYNYAPQFKALISQSHAVAEIFCAPLGKWVIFDPWFGTAFKVGERWLNVDDLMTMKPQTRSEVSALEFVISRKALKGPTLSYLNYFGTATFGPTETGPVVQ